MAGSLEGAVKTAAARVGLPVEEYRRRVDAGFKRCTRCKAWKLREQFDVDRSRGDGLAAQCIDCRRVTVHRKRVGGPPDKRTHTLAIETVRTAVRRGRLAPVKSLPCLDCGRAARHYHHHLGYERAHWLDVVPLCVGCHRRRHME